MSIKSDVENIVNPLQKSALNKKSLCDYVINIASGCLHGCTFCYVPSTPAIRTRQKELNQRGVKDPQLDWGNYLFIRKEIPQKLEKTLSRKRTWHVTESGQGVVLLCSGTDPYQNKQTAEISRKSIQILIHYKKRVRVLTRGLLWVNDLDILTHKNITLGMSLPCIKDEIIQPIEPYSPPPSKRYKALLQAKKTGCRLYVAMAPTPPNMTLEDFKFSLDKISEINPEVIFWEPINARGTNGKRMLAAGLEFAKSVMTKKLWAENFKQQWEYIRIAAEEVGCLEKIHFWPDPELKGYIDQQEIDNWLYRKTIEKWE